MSLESEKSSGLIVVAEELYRDSTVSPSVVKALVLLAQALSFITQALQLIKEDQLAADVQVQAVRPLLRKLFMCREIGDGFASVVSALIGAIENNHGLPLEGSQLNSIQVALSKLRDQPFLSFDVAIRVIEEIERAGFRTEPPGFEHLADWLTI